MVSRLKQLTEQKHCTLSAEPETLQNIYKLHKCCIKRIFFFRNKIYTFFLAPNRLVPHRLFAYADVQGFTGSDFLTATQGQITSCTFAIQQGFKNKSKEKKKTKKQHCQIAYFFYGFNSGNWNSLALLQTAIRACEKIFVPVLRNTVRRDTHRHQSRSRFYANLSQ